MNSENLICELTEFIKKELVKNEVKTIFKPFIDFILYEINPYIYSIIILVFLILIILLINLILLLLIATGNYPITSTSILRKL